MSLTNTFIKSTASLSNTTCLEARWASSSYCNGGACLEARWASSSHCTSGTNCLEARWASSSHCAGGECLQARWAPADACGSSTCVECRYQDGKVQVRDSKETDGPVLTFGPDAWDAFLNDIKNGVIS